MALLLPLYQRVQAFGLGLWCRFQEHTGHQDRLDCCRPDSRFSALLHLRWLDGEGNENAEMQAKFKVRRKGEAKTTMKETEDEQYERSGNDEEVDVGAAYHILYNLYV
jgi:hypothetical protein